MKKKTKTMIITAVVLISTAAVYFVFNFEKYFNNIPEQITITVAWNPGSTANDIVRVMSGNIKTQTVLQNIPGANGANGLNAVFNAEHDGTNLLSTSLSAFVTSEAMGFAQSSPSDWTAWLVAFSPAVLVVAADSPYIAVNELAGLTCADSGFGTVSFAAARLLSGEYEHISFSGVNAAVNALFDGEADFAVLLKTEISARLDSGELRILETMDFGEYYGLFVPADVQKSRLKSLDRLLENAVASEAFAAFIDENGLQKMDYDRGQSVKIINEYGHLLRDVLNKAGFLPA
ncbi:MAG: tripartite tricarboxylate transporter substrate-binding protein [Oscillospiraceae bacterium]|nr:tripartite tricarboxylate transporter substrate-binding protein [Oscillospiraceae bacterium]